MSTPVPLHSAPDSPQLTPHHHHVSPVNTTPLNLSPHLNVINQSAREPPHYSSLISKTLCLDKHYSVCVEEVIAEGGFGVIFLVKNSGEKVKYALKRVVVNSNRDYEGVLGEVAVMSLISPKTPHLLRSLTHMILHYPPSTYEIQNLMPLCKQNLLQLASQRIQKSQNFEATEILQILTHVSNGLQYLHSASIIHRDIKIENILLLDETYVLSDFGSATCKQWDPRVDPINAIQEDLDKNTTLQYRSPEMVDLYGGRGAISVASDIWALGVCGFKLMSFKDPFESILAIQNRNLNWSTTKSRYPDNLVLLIEVLLAEHQQVRPTVEQVIKITTSALASDWQPVTTAYNRTTEEKKRLEQEASVRRTTQAANIVMETTVTPRQRPKRNLGVTTPSTGGSSVASTTGVIIPPVLAPPKSPKPVSPSPVAGTVDTNARFFSPPQQTISPTQPQTTPSPTPQQTSTPATSWTGGVTSQATTGGSYNPFDEEYVSNDTTTNPPVPNDDGVEFDVFANAPFDFFKYVPVSSETHQYDHHPYTNATYYAANNPFLYPYDMSNNNAESELSTGVCNLSFEDGVVTDAANNVSSKNGSSDS